jgi:hypothetical protein
VELFDSSRDLTVRRYNDQLTFHVGSSDDSPERHKGNWAARSSGVVPATGSAVASNNAAFSATDTVKSLFTVSNASIIRRE